MATRLRLGLDLGTNSIGWALVHIDNDNQPCGILRQGVRIFPDGRNPKDQSSRAVDRRLARQQRRQRDRYLKRRKRLMDTLIQHGLMPKKELERKKLETENPYKLRKKGLDEPLEPYHLGRAIFHIGQRRGFKSNRKTDSSAEDAGKVKSAISETRNQIATSDMRTYGEWLDSRMEQRFHVRARMIGEGAGSEYELYADRSLLDDEIKALWTEQKKFNANICTDNALQAIQDVIFYQRPLRPVNPGPCTFEENEHRAPLAALQVQRFRIYQELNNLRIIDKNYSDRMLALDERNTLAQALEKKEKLKFKDIAKLLQLEDSVKFNLEATRDYLDGNKTSVKLATKQRIGKQWHTLTSDDQNDIVKQILDEENEGKLTTYLVKKLDISEEAAVATANCKLPDGYGKLSFKAIDKIMPYLKNEVITYDKAAKRAGYNHSDFHTGKLHAVLPYYGQILNRYTGDPIETSSNPDEARYGKISNPTVHIGLKGD